MDQLAPMRALGRASGVVEGGLPAAVPVAVPSAATEELDGGMARAGSRRGSVVLEAASLRASGDPRMEAVSLSVGRKRSVDNPFFQKTEDDLRLEQLADLMKVSLHVSCCCLLSFFSHLVALPLG